MAKRNVQTAKRNLDIAEKHVVQFAIRVVAADQREQETRRTQHQRCLASVAGILPAPAATYSHAAATHPVAAVPPMHVIGSVAPTEPATTAPQDHDN